jgi:hypothetical protein
MNGNDNNNSFLIMFYIRIFVHKGASNEVKCTTQPLTAEAKEGIHEPSD